MFLVSDIGGTNTRLALCEEGDHPKLVAEKTYSSSEEKDLHLIINKFLSEQKASVEKAAIAIAGPIRNGVCKTTNLPWVIDAKELSQKSKIKRVYLLNDLLANAYGIGVLKPEEFITINSGETTHKGNACLISAGTGLGQAGIVMGDKESLPFASEGGHSDFAPRDKREFELLLFLKEKYGHVSYERILSGPGLVELYEFLSKSEKSKPGKELVEKMKRENNKPKVITELGLGGDSFCEEVLDWFISFYGAEAGNLALKFLAVSGVYIGGGIAPKIADRMSQGGFMQAFIDKGRFQGLMESIPVRLITNDKTALLGAAEYGLMQE